MALKEFVGATCTETVSGIIFDLRNPSVEDIDINDISWSLSRINRYTGHTITKKPYSVAQHTVMVSRYCEWALTPGNEFHDMFQRFIEGKLTEACVGTLEDEDRKYQIRKWSDLQDFTRHTPGNIVKMVSLHGLLHDFAEAYLTDVPSPVKRLPGMYEAIREAESKLEPVIFKAMGLEYSPTQWPGTYENGCMVVHWADMIALKIEAYHMMPSRGLSWNLPQEKPTLKMLDGFRWPIDAEKARDELIDRHNELKPDEPIYG